MPESIVIIARGIFEQKYKELVAIRDRLREKNKTELPPADLKKLKEYEALVAEIGKNYQRADKLLKEIRRLAK